MQAVTPAEEAAALARAVRAREKRRAALRAAWFCGPLALWLYVIFVSSGPRGNYVATYNAAKTFLHFMVGRPIPDDPTLYAVNETFRKWAYVIEYGVLVALTVRAIQWGSARLKRVSVGASVGLGVLFALADGFHRRSTPGRHENAQDFWLIGAGIVGFLALTFLWFVLKRIERALLAPLPVVEPKPEAAKTVKSEENSR